MGLWQGHKLLLGQHIGALKYVACMHKCAQGCFDLRCKIGECHMSNSEHGGYKHKAWDTPALSVHQKKHLNPSLFLPRHNKFAAKPGSECSCRIHQIGTATSLQNTGVTKVTLFRCWLCCCGAGNAVVEPAVSVMFARCSNATPAKPEAGAKNRLSFANFGVKISKCLLLSSCDMSPQSRIIFCKNCLPHLTRRSKGIPAILSIHAGTSSGLSKGCSRPDSLAQLVDEIAFMCFTPLPCPSNTEQGVQRGNT